MGALATLAGVSTLARRLLGGIRVPYAAAAVFLFPGIFLYDSSLITGADHVLAFFAPALALALIRLGRRFEPREAALAGILTIRTRRLRPALLWGLSCLAVSSSHWLKNWIFYGDPFHPLLNSSRSRKANRLLKSLCCRYTTSGVAIRRTEGANVHMRGNPRQSSMDRW